MYSLTNTMHTLHVHGDWIQSLCMSLGTEVAFNCFLDVICDVIWWVCQLGPAGFVLLFRLMPGWPAFSNFDLNPGLPVMMFSSQVPRTAFF